MRNYIPCITLALSIVSTAAAAEPGSRMERLDQAANTGAVGALQQHRAELAEKAAGDDAKPIDRYNFAYLGWRLGGLMMQPSAEKERDVYLKQAQETLEALIESEPGNAEALALLSGVLGMRIGDSAMRGMTMGPKSSSLIKKAARLAPDNPRVALQQGISYFHTPKMWGGSLEKAVQELGRAAALFAGEPPDAPWPNWGRLDALAWLGQALARQGKTAEARAVYQQALALEPDMGWIRFALLPALDKDKSSSR